MASHRSTRWLGALALASACAVRAGTLPDTVFADGFESTCGAIVFAESFATPAAGTWPPAWSELGGSADVADVTAGEGRLRPVISGYSLARLYASAATRDVEVRFVMTLEDATRQGVGFYVRQNGGYLTQSMPSGSGYAVFVEGTFRGLPGVGVWREVNGMEMQIAHSGAAAPAPQTGQRYRVRFRTHQVDAGHSLLQAKIWADGAVEPAAWQVSASDDTAVLQGVTGGVAVDSWNSNTAGTISAHTRIDDIEVESLCNPIELRGGVDTVAESFQFLEGPLWRGDHLLFSDIAGDTIHRLDPPLVTTVFRSPSAMSNGLALDGLGRLLAAEHGSRSVTRTEFGGGVTTLVSTFQGLRLNSPNDIAVASDGTLYFTDPDYGLTNPLVQRELAFNGVFRIAPGGGLTAEWQGVVGQNEPNGIALSLDESTVYVTDTQAGALLAFDRAPDGSLANRRTLASGLVIPDGLCTDDDGNVYIATWANTIEVFAPDGARWGSVLVPRQATNCAFGGASRQTLYVTAHEGLYRVQMPVPGAPY